MCFDDKGSQQVIVPDGYHTITPYFTVSEADKLIEFLVNVLGGVTLTTARYPDGTVQHARVRIGDSVVMLNEGTEDYLVNVSQMHVYVDDADRVFSEALAAGAEMIMRPNNRPHGDRMAGIKDPCGNVWWIATYTAKRTDHSA